VRSAAGGTTWLLACTAGSRPGRMAAREREDYLGPLSGTPQARRRGRGAPAQHGSLTIAIVARGRRWWTRRLTSRASRQPTCCSTSAATTARQAAAPRRSRTGG
jgi:hypothetical protein